MMEENANALQNNMLGDNKAMHTSFAPAPLHNSKGLPIRQVHFFRDII